nr:hypothetical protein [Escherichia coli]
MLPSETMIWQPEFTDKTLSRKPGAVQTTVEVFGFKVFAVRGKDEFRLGLACCRAGLKCSQHLCDLAPFTGQNVDVVCLKNTTQVGLIRCPGAQTFDGRFLVTKGFKKSIRKLYRIKGLLCKIRDGLFNFYGVHLRTALHWHATALLLLVCSELMSYPRFS